MDGEILLNAVKEGLETVDHDTDELVYGGPVTGGIVNQAASYKTKTKKYFVKWNSKLCVSKYFYVIFEAFWRYTEKKLALFFSGYFSIPPGLLLSSGSGHALTIYI